MSFERVRIEENPDADGIRGKGSGEDVTAPQCIVWCCNSHPFARTSKQAPLNRSGVEFEFEVEKVLPLRKIGKAREGRSEEGGRTDERTGGRKGGRSATANKSGPENCPSGKTRAGKLTAAVATEGTRRNRERLGNDGKAERETLNRFS